MSSEIFLVGASNCGKTTLFNGLTGKDEQVGNWHGVTTKAQYGTCRINGESITVVDLPGGYLDCDFTLENERQKNALKKDAFVLFLIQAQNISASLTLLKKISSLTQNVIVVINMYSELKRSGGAIDINALSRELNCECIFAECDQKQGVNAVNRLIARFLMSKSKFNSNFDCEKTLKKCFKAPYKNYYGAIDDFLLNGINFFISFAFAFLVIFYLAFGKYGIASVLCNILEKVYQYAVYQPIATLFNSFASPFIVGFILEGILGGIFAVISFLPRLCVISLFNSFLEQSGLLARIAFMLDPLLCKIGLSGRAVLTLFCGYGCTTVAVKVSDGLENQTVRRRAIKCLPYLSCTAKTPVYLYLLYSFGAQISFAFTCLVYVVGFVLGMLICFIDFKLSKSQTQRLIIEFTPLRMPKLKTLFKALQKFVKGFIIKVGLIVTLVTALLYVLRSVSPSFTYLSKEQANLSVLYAFAQKIGFIFAPLNLTDSCFSLCAVCGLFAKESIVSVLTLFKYQPLTLKQTLAYLTFCYLYPPCFSATFYISCEVGKRFAFISFVKQTVIALACCYAVADAKYLLALLVVIITILIIKSAYEKINRNQTNKINSLFTKGTRSRIKLRRTYETVSQKRYKS